MGPRTLFIRRSERHVIVLPARARSRTGFTDHVIISDLSTDGCRIESAGLTLDVGDLVTLRPEGLESLFGKICWRKGRCAGVKFTQALYLPVVEHLARRHATFLATLPAGAEMHRRAA